MTSKIAKVNKRLNLQSNPFINSIDELLKQVPGMIMAQALKDFTMERLDKKMKIKKGSVIVLPKSQFDKTKRGSGLCLKPYRRTFSEFFNRYTGQNLDGKRLLVWRTGGYGDLMFIQPILRYLKDTYPTCQITFATAPENVSLFNNWPVGIIDYVAAMPFDKDLMIKHDYHLTFEGAIERCLESKKVNYYDIFKKVAGVKFDLDNYPLVLDINPIMDKHFKEHIKPNTIAIQLRASTPLRTLSIEKVKEIVDRLVIENYNVTFLDSSQYSAWYDQFITNFGYDKTVVSNFTPLCKDITMGITILNNCAGVITVDSAFAHFAEALKKPGVGLYGPFPSQLITTYYKHIKSLNPPQGWNECQMSPCYLHAPHAVLCPYIKSGQLPGCMQSFDINEIIKILKDNII